MCGERFYYAIDLANLGCGKDHFTPLQAVKDLISDHGYLINAVNAIKEG